MRGLPASMQIPDDIVYKIKSLDDDLANGDLTDKGYWKKKSCLLKKHLQDEPNKQLDVIEASWKSKQLAEDDYIVQVKDLLEDVNNYENGQDGDIEMKNEADDVENAHSNDGNERDEHVKKQRNSRGHSVKRRAVDTDAHQIGSKCKKQMDIRSMFNKVCLNKAVEKADDDDLLSDEEVEYACQPKVVPSPMMKMRDRPSKYCKAAVKWLTKPKERRKGNCYYTTAMVNMELVNVNDNVLVAPYNADDSQMVARVVYMWQTKNGDHMFHAHWYCRSNNTILGDVCDPKELFIVDECQDAHMDTIISLASVIHKKPSQQWNQEGGVQESFSIDQHAFFYQKFYSRESARFEDPPYQIINNGSVKALDSCVSCNRLQQLRKQQLPIVGEQIKEKSGKAYFSHVMYNNERFNVGDCVYISPDAYKMPASSCPKKRNHLKQDYDEEMYPEYYRKTSEYVNRSNQDLPSPFHIGKIEQIFRRRNSMSFVGQYDVYVKVQKFYRPHNTSMSSNECTLADLNMLYWSGDETVVEWQAIQGKCSVVYKDNLHDGLAEYIKGGPNRFYFFEAYNSQNKSFDEPPTSAKLMGSKGQVLQTYPTCQKLRCLDVFAGCGGLSEGFHQANLSETCWAIEKEEAAAHAFKLNFPKAEVFTEDCNDFLKLVMDGEKTNSKGQALPQKGDVEILCGGPPCQGFSSSIQKSTLNSRFVFHSSAQSNGTYSKGL